MAKSLSRGPTGRDELLQDNISRTKKQSTSSGEKKDDKNIAYGTKKGSIKFGHLHLGSEGELGADVQSGVMLQAFDSRHYMTMDNDGVRKGWTLNRCPGPYLIKCASDSAGVMDTDNDLLPEGIGYLLLAEKGDIVIRAPKGRIRLSALDIDIRADGQDNTRGSININSNQSVNIETPIFDVKAATKIRLYTPDSMNIIADTSLTFVSNFMNGLTAASSLKPNKLNYVSTAEYLAKTGYTPQSPEIVDLM